MTSHRFKTFLFSLFGAIVFIGCQNSDTNGQNTLSNQSQQGAKVVITEYSDFQCPACAYFFPIVEKLKDEYGSNIEVNYKYFPLNSHQFAMLAARAAESARNQGKFEEMHDMLFQNQKKWSGSGNPQPIFMDYAKKMGLDINQFKDDLNAAQTQQAVMQQKKKGEEDGVDSTPTFFINGEKVVSLPRTYKQFKALVDIYVKEAKSAQGNE